MRLLVVEDDVLLGEALAPGCGSSAHAVDWFADGASADAALGRGIRRGRAGPRPAARRRHGVAATLALSAA
jgi:hypothetical protein